MESLVVNLLLTFLTDQKSIRVRFSEAYYKSAETKPYRHEEVEAESFCRVLQAAVHAGIIRRLSVGNTVDGVSKVAPGPWLLDRFRSGAWSHADIGHDGTGPTVILKEDRAEDGWRFPGEPPLRRMNYRRTDLTHSMERRMLALNARLADLELAVHWNPAEDGARSPPWDANKRWLYRVFTHGSLAFDYHGRLYGGFWIMMPSDQRWRITIDGERLVQLDLSAAFVFIRYAMEGAPWPSHLDPYDIDAVKAAYIETGIEPERASVLSRKAVKTLMSAWWFDGGERTRFPHLREGDPPDLWLSGRKGRMRAGDMLAEIADHHKAIADHPRGIGHRLFLEESEIILAALEACFAAGIPALPVHDAILVKQSQYEAAGRLMAKAFHTRLGAWPVIKSRPLFDPFTRDYLNLAGFPANDGVLRSMDSVGEPEWVEQHPQPETPPERYPLRSRYNRIEIANTVGLAYMARGELILWALRNQPHLQTSTVLGSLLLALAIQEDVLRTRLSFERMEGEQRCEAASLIADKVRRCIKAAVLKLNREQLEALAADLKHAGLADAGLEVAESEYTKPRKGR